MIQLTTQAPDSRPADKYPDFASGIKTIFDAGAGPLFTITAEGHDLWQAFLDNLPDEGRQHYNCNCCRHFIQRYGGLVRVSEKGVKTSAVWGKKQPAFFQKSVDAMLKIIEASEIDGVFITSETVLGNPVTGEWHHMHVVPPANLVWGGNNTANQQAAKLRQNFKVLVSSLEAYTIDTVRKALKLLDANALYRGEQILGVATWFKTLQEKRMTASSKGSARWNLTWLAVATAPDGFCHVKNTMIGTLLDDLVEGYEFSAVTARFQAKMAQYQRAQVAPSAGNIQRGEEIVREMDSAGSLQRRYATMQDIPEFVWLPASVKKKTKTAKASTGDGVFSGVTPRTKAAPVPTTPDMPAAKMTWAKFSTLILPSATSVALKVPATSERFMALVTAVNNDAPPILQWDMVESRNPVSWYYAFGVDAEIRRRVLNAGGQHEDVDIRGSLIWNNYNDLDLHCITPYGEEIFFHHKRSRCDGWLDVDMNVHGETNTPVENIRWARGHARAGNYRFFVQNYRNDRMNRHHPYRSDPTPFKVELQVGNQIFVFEGVIPAGACNQDSNIIAFDFQYNPGQPVNIRSLGAVVSAQPGNNWNVAPASFVPVTGITLSPNLWGKQPQPHHGSHVFFLLEGCRDMDGGQARGFFAESLRNEYREIRSVIEAFAASAGVIGADGAQACGVGMSNHADWNLTLRVTNENGTSDYVLDRWD